MITTGICRYCGQVQSLENEVDNQETADRLATLDCDCDDAKRDRWKQELLDAAREVAEGDGVDTPGIGLDNTNMVLSLTEAAFEGRVNKITLQIAGTKISIKRANDKVKIERKDVKTLSAER